MFTKKEYYITIPYALKIWRGDHLLVKNLKTGLYSGNHIKTQMSVTVNKFKQKASMDTSLYKKWRARPKNITFIVVTYNNIGNIKMFMKAFIKNDNNFAIIIDNNSTDGTRKYLESLPNDNIMIVINEEKLSDERCIDIGKKLSFPSNGFVMCDSSFVFNNNFIE